MAGLDPNGGHSLDHFVGARDDGWRHGDAGLLPPDEFYSVSLLAPVSQNPPNRFGIIAALMKFDPEVPNDTGQITFAVGSKTVTLDVGDYNPPEPEIRPPNTVTSRAIFAARSIRISPAKVVASPFTCP